MAFLFSGFCDEKFERQQCVAVRKWYGTVCGEGCNPLRCSEQKENQGEKALFKFFLMVQMMYSLPVGVDVFHASVLAKTEL